VGLDGVVSPAVQVHHDESRASASDPVREPVAVEVQMERLTHRFHPQIVTERCDTER
jgi:hypothetical protein